MERSVIGCEHKGCKREALFGVKVCTPATGFAIDLHTPLTMLLGVKLCREHFEELDVAELVKDPKMREIIRIQARACGSMVPPDFARTFKERVRLGSAEWQRFERMRKTGK